MDGTPCAKIGKVTESPVLLINDAKGKNIVSADVFRLKKAWQSPLNW